MNETGSCGLAPKVPQPGDAREGSREGAKKKKSQSPKVGADVRNAAHVVDVGYGFQFHLFRFLPFLPLLKVNEARGPTKGAATPR